jgi:hypothetical protein
MPTLPLLLDRPAWRHSGLPEETKPEGNDLSIASLENNAFLSGGQVLN